MGLFDAPTATSTGTQNQTQQTNYAPWTQAFNQNVAGAAWNMLAPQLQTSPFQVAGLNPDQMRAFDMTRDMTMNAFRPNQNLNQSTQALMGGAGNMQAAQTGPTDYKPFMTPFLNDVGRTTLSNMRSEYQNADANLAAQYAGRQAFGGSGEAIARGQAARGYNENVGSTIANLMAQGYDRASATAQANTALRQQANAQNAEVAMAMPALLDRLQTSEQQRQTGALQSLLGVGNQQQAFQQTAMDSPLRALEMLLGVAPNVYDQTQTMTGSSSERAPTGGSSIGQQLVGFGLSQLGRPRTGTGSIGNTVLGGILGL